jgi:hypothetical protein
VPKHVHNKKQRPKARAYALLARRGLTDEAFPEDHWHDCQAAVNADQEVQRRDDQEMQRSGLGYQTTADTDNSL